MYREIEGGVLIINPVQAERTSILAAVVVHTEAAQSSLHYKASQQYNTTLKQHKRLLVNGDF